MRHPLKMTEFSPADACVRFPVRFSFIFLKIRQTNRILFPTYFLLNHFKKSITEEEKDGSDVYRIPMTPSTRTAFHFSSFSKKNLKKKHFQ
jgi:hypothetical protein